MTRVRAKTIVWTTVLTAALYAPPDRVVRAEDNRVGKEQVAAVVPAGRSPATPQSLKVLSSTDVKNYNLIFSLQEKGDMREANQVMLRVQDRILLGHVLAERYLHPTAYTSNYFELATWMQSFADHPQAERIYRLALRRKPDDAPPPRPPAHERSFEFMGGEDEETPYRQALNTLSPGTRKTARELYHRVLNSISDGMTMRAKIMLLDSKVTRQMPRFLSDKLRARLAMAYFGDGRYKYALEWAEQAAQGSGEKFAMPYWTAGLASWRTGDMNRALRHFKVVAGHREATGPLRAAGAFWVARIYSRQRNASMVNRYLASAAKYPRSFYGILARKHLGMGLGFDWKTPRAKSGGVADLQNLPAGRRAIALLQLGRSQLAEKEIGTLAANSNERDRRLILATANQLGMPDLALKVNVDQTRSGARTVDFASYPMPPWEPISGFRIDRALIFAIARQESKFRVNAYSSAGARGVLQLMPATAKLMASKLGITIDPNSLTHDLEANLELGQAYLNYLLNKPEIDGNLLLTLAAWNAGPTNPLAWKRTKLYGEDPLMFIESIPWQETRLFVKNVMSNYWIYRSQLGQKQYSLGELAAGQWPKYRSQDD